MYLYTRIGRLHLQDAHLRALPPSARPEAALDRIDECTRAIESSYLPSGSGFDAGCTLDLSATHPRIIVQYHHLSEHGYYTGWSYHVATLKPCLAYGVDIDIDTIAMPEGEEDVDGFLDYLAETLHAAVTAEYMHAP